VKDEGENRGSAGPGETWRQIKKGEEPKPFPLLTTLQPNY